MDGHPPGTANAPMPPARLDAAAAAIGGVLGATARWAVGVALDLESPSTGAVPWHTLTVNVVGCFLIGVFATRTDGVRRTFAVTGLLGGFTTMSAVAVETDQLASSSGLAAAIYLGVSIAAGLVAVLIGERLGRRRSSGGPA